MSPIGYGSPCLHALTGESIATLFDCKHVEREAFFLHLGSGVLKARPEALDQGGHIAQVDVKRPGMRQVLRRAGVEDEDHMLSTLGGQSQGEGERQALRRARRLRVRDQIAMFIHMLHGTVEPLYDFVPEIDSLCIGGQSKAGLSTAAATISRIISCTSSSCRPANIGTCPHIFLIFLSNASDCILIMEVHMQILNSN